MLRQRGSPNKAVLALRETPACLGACHDNITLRARLSSASLMPTTASPKVSSGLTPAVYIFAYPETLSRQGLSVLTQNTMPTNHVLHPLPSFPEVSFSVPLAPRGRIASHGHHVGPRFTRQFAEPLSVVTSDAGGGPESHQLILR
eukprot:4512480-Pyramimonas_sp.AAC.1